MKYIPSTGPFCREAYPFGLPPLAISVVSFVAGFSLVGLLFLGVAGFVFWFFRNPDRVGPADSNAVWSPADGKIVGVGIVPHNEMPDGQALKISIFLSLINVHVAWSPVAGRVEKAEYFPGKFLNAMNDKSAEENERKILTMVTPDGERMIVALIAGLVARRIVCPIDAGDEVERGEKIGLIRFGSRTEIYLPANYTPEVRVGQMVSGSQTVLARSQVDGNQAA